MRRLLRVPKEGDLQLDLTVLLKLIGYIVSKAIHNYNR